MFNAGETVGRLRIVPLGTAYESLLFDRKDIVILQESYPDISPVSGILSMVFSTPLSHVNLRARAWQIPNAGFVNARQAHSALDGKMVFFSVTDTGHVMRKATPEEITAAENKVAKARKVTLPQADTYQRRLKVLTDLGVDDARAYGTKTANLGAIASARLPQVNVPPGFGIPFHHYVAHMQRHELDLVLSQMLRDPRWSKDALWRRQAAKALREKIKSAKTDPALLDRIESMVGTHLAAKGVFVRSSTNAEDLEGFSGAGLYDTVGNVLGREALSAAVRQVWASLWNFRAVEERALYGIKHRDVYAAVLVQFGVDSTAAGVLVTTNLFDPSDKNSYTINAKRGLGIRVVEGATVPEQIIFDTKNNGTKIISRSDDPTMLVFDKSGGIVEVPNPNRDVILDEERSRRLAHAVRSFVRLIPSKRPLDIEWALTGEKVWILQARPFIGP
jgi:phosphoenolpyruvate synthase/pyruvate phosphate dikinase